MTAGGKGPVTPVDLSKLSVLVVDDEASVARLVAMMLADFGVTQIFTTKDGEEALDFLRDLRDVVDIIICDWNMPNMSGIELLQQVRRIDPGMPFLMLTGRADMASVREAKDFGVSSYLAKPFTAEQLAQRLSALARQVPANR